MCSKNILIPSAFTRCRTRAFPVGLHIGRTEPRNWKGQLQVDQVPNEICCNCLHESGTFFIRYRSSPDPLSGQISSELGSGWSRINARQIRTFLVAVPNGSGIKIQINKILCGDLVTPTTFYEISKISHICSIFHKSVCIRVVHIF